MKSRINIILEEIDKKRAELKKEYVKLMDKYNFSFNFWKIKFDSKIIKLHKLQKKPLYDTIFNAKFREILSIPFIYSVFFPIVLLDLFLFVYQQVAFRLYRIPFVKRSDYIIYDRVLLNYLNIIQKINCLYCSYVNWFLSYAVEIWWRTERYWCPIKNAKKLDWWHSREKYFSDYGDSEWFREAFCKNEDTYKK